MKRLQGSSILPVNPRYNVRAISWSDVLAIESNVERWCKGLRMESNRSMQYGIAIHAQIKHRKLKNIPIGNAPDITYHTEISDGKVLFGIIGKTDDSTDDTIIEYKTGMKLWTQKKAREHGQLFTYALLKWKTTGIMPKEALLVSLETKDDEDADDLVLTGKVRVFRVPITMLDVLKIQSRFVKAYKAVEKYLASVSK